MASGKTSVLDVCVVGAGYIGYPLSLVLVEAGHRVVAVDSNPAVVDAINRGQPLAAEDSVHELARRTNAQARLTASKEIPQADVYMIAVPTPVDESGKKADLRSVHSAAEALSSKVRDGALVILESTVPPGTTESLMPILTRELRDDERIYLAHCPERLHPGATLEELVFNDRIVGGIDEASSKAVSDLYSTFVQGDLITTDSVTAELCKLFENAYRDVNLALTNQMAGVAEHFEVDPVVTLEMASRHPRVDYLRPSIGVGGHCIPVDPWFLHQAAPHLTPMIVSAREANVARETLTAERIKAFLSGTDPTVVLAGIAYKPDVADSRESPALRIKGLLVESGVDVRIYDPIVGTDSDPVWEVAEDADLVAVTVAHTKMIETLKAEQDRIEAVMRQPQILDFSSGFARPLL